MESWYSVFYPPVFIGDQVKTDETKLAHNILLGLVAASGLFSIAIPFITIDFLYRLVLSSSTFVAFSVLYIFNFTGQVQFVKKLIPPVSYFVLLIACTVSGGVNAPWYNSFVLVVVIAALLMGSRAGIFYAGLCILTGFGLWYFDDIGILPYITKTHPPFLQWLVSAIYLTLVTILLYLAVTNMETVVKKIAASQKELLKKNETLLKTQESLKKRSKDLAEVNAQLNLEISDRREADRKLNKSLSEKDVLIKEVHHRVKNNLQVINSMIMLQSAHLKDAAAVEALQDCYNRIRSMSSVHELLYQSDSLSEIEFTDYLTKLTDYLIQSFVGKSEHVEIRLLSDKCSVPLENAIHMGLIVNELISNALRHAFDDGQQGVIEINFSTNNALCSLRIRDNGKGFPENIDFKNSPALGLQLVNTLVDQMKGKIELRSENGTEFKIAVPNTSPKSIPVILS